MASGDVLFPVSLSSTNRPINNSSKPTPPNTIEPISDVSHVNAISTGVALVGMDVERELNFTFGDFGASFSPFFAINKQPLKSKRFGVIDVECVMGLEEKACTACCLAWNDACTKYESNQNSSRTFMVTKVHTRVRYCGSRGVE